ncbi:MAG TPA: TetR/AcrR family transcriptional regulator [Blastocatellia bacterium]|nr:TetR/AcrR family transcriptional regulator [Blastocatellia bacterium]
MGTQPKESLKPRKKPVQARSAFTVESVLEATIQVLLKDGAAHLTTTRVAERAGVSVGTLYQYYPNKRSLLYALLENHLTSVGDAVKRACRETHNKPLNTWSPPLPVTSLMRSSIEQTSRPPYTNRVRYGGQRHSGKDCGQREV